MADKPIETIEDAERAIREMGAPASQNFSCEMFEATKKEVLEILQRLKASLFSQKALPKTTEERIDSVVELRKALENIRHESVSDTDGGWVAYDELEKTIDSFEAGLREEINRHENEADEHAKTACELKLELPAIWHNHTNRADELRRVLEGRQK